MAWTEDCPQPGVYDSKQIGHERYFNLRAVNASLLKAGGLERGNWTPARVKHAMDQEFTPTMAMLTGSAMHACLFEPKVFENDVIELGEVPVPEDRRKKGGRKTLSYGTTASKAAIELAHELHPGKIVVADGVREQCLQMYGVLMENDTIRPMLQQQGKREATMIWRHEATGLMCKAKVDTLIEPIGGTGVQREYKTTASLEDRAWERTFMNFGYWFSSAFYRLGYAAIHGTDSIAPTEYIVQETKAPYLCRVVTVSEQWFELGRIMVEDALRSFAKSFSTGEWPGLPAKPMWMFPPDWFLSKFSDEELGQGGYNTPQPTYDTELPASFDLPTEEKY